MIGIAAVTVAFAATAVFVDFAPVAGVWVDSPESVLNGLIHRESGGLSAGVFVALCGALLGVICLGLAFIPRRAAALAVAVAVFAFGGSVSGYAFERLLSSRTPGAVPVTGQERVRDWIDGAASGHSVAVLAYPVSRTEWGPSAILWWDVEFWNNSVTQAFVVPDGTFTYTPFPSRTLAVDFATGQFDGTAAAPPFVLVSPSDSRFALAGTQAAANVGLMLIIAERPYRALWATRGLDADGWTRPGRPATVRVFSEPGRTSRLVRVSILLDSPPEASAPVEYRLGDAAGAVAPGMRSVAVTEICVPARGHADQTLVAGRAATIAGLPLLPKPGPRTVGLAVSAVGLETLGDCRP